eukprot:489831_1
MAHVATVSDKKSDEAMNTLNPRLDPSNQIEDDSDDAKFVEAHILAQMTESEMKSLQSHLDSTRLINRKLDWQHVVSAVMHELDENISFYVARSVEKLNISMTVISAALEKKLNKKMSKQEIEYVRQLIRRAKQNTKVTPTAAIPYAFQMQNHIEAPRVYNADDDSALLDGNLLIDIYNAYRIYKFTTFHFQSYEKEAFIEAIKGNKFIKQNKSDIVNEFNANYDHQMRFELYPSWLIADDQFIIFNYFFCCSYVVNALRANPPRNRMKIAIYIIPNKIVSVYDENIVFPWSIEPNVSNLLMDNGFDTFLRASITDQSCKDKRKLLNIIEYYLKAPASGYLEQDLLLIVDRRGHGNVLYVLNASPNNDKLVKLHQNHLLGMEFDILAPDNEDTVVQCYLRKGIGEKARFYPEHLTLLMCRLFKQSSDDLTDDYEYIQRVYSPSYCHGFGTDLADPILDKYHKLILNSLHISVNYNRDYVPSALRDDTQCDKYEYVMSAANDADIAEWARQCNLEERKQAQHCPYVHFAMGELRRFAEYDEYQIPTSDSTKFNELTLNLALDHLISVHSFCVDQKQRAEIKDLVHDQNGACAYGLECVVLQHFSN